MFVIPLTLIADSIGNALDCSSNSWTSGGASNWYAQNSTTHDGSDAVQSGAISHNQTSWMETAVNGPANISFWWKVSSESGYDYLKFYIDGVEQDSISGETSWAQKTYTLTSGSHTLKWVYSKDGSVNNGSDIIRSRYAGASVTGKLLFVGFEYLQRVKVEDKYHLILNLLAELACQTL